MCVCTRVRTCVRVCLCVCVRSFCWFWTVSQFLSDDIEPQEIVQATYVLAHECVGGSVCTHVCVCVRCPYLSVGLWPVSLL